MSNKPVKKESEAVSVFTDFNRDQFTSIKKFNDLLNKDPMDKWIKVNKFSDNAKYIPIRIVESLLRSLFGVYQVEMVGQPHIVGNSVVVSVHLKVYHPILKEWLVYAGTGAVPIELEKNSNPLEFDRIKPKALHKNIPAAKSFAVSNAAKSLGKIFGSDLNNDELSQIYNVYQI
jgi:hypothetical protein